MAEGLARDLVKVRRGDVCLRLGLDSNLNPSPNHKIALYF